MAPAGLFGTRASGLSATVKPSENLKRNLRYDLDMWRHPHEAQSVSRLCCSCASGCAVEKHTMSKVEILSVIHMNTVILLNIYYIDN